MAVDYVFNSLSKISSNDARSPAAAGGSPGSHIPAQRRSSEPVMCTAPCAVFASDASS